MIKAPWLHLAVPLLIATVAALTILYPTAIAPVQASSLHSSMSTSGMLVPTASPGVTLPFTDGFESGNFSRWQSVTTTGSGAARIDTTTPYQGSDDAYFTRSASVENGDGAVAKVNFPEPGGKIVWAAASVRWDSIPNIWYNNVGNVLGIEYQDHSAPKARFFAHKGNKLGWGYYKKDGTVYNADWSAPIQIGKYYGLKIKFDNSGHDPVISWYVNPGSGWIQVDQFTDTSSGNAYTPNEVDIGTFVEGGLRTDDPVYAGTVQVHIDDVKIATTDPDGGTVTATSTPTTTPTSQKTGTPTVSPTKMPTPTSTATSTSTPTTAPPTATPTPTSSSSSTLINEPIVFVSRQIPVDGSKFYSPSTGTGSYPGVGDFSRFVSAGPGKLQILEPDGSIRTLLDGNNPDPVYHLVDFNAPNVSYDGTKIVFAGFVPTTNNPNSPQYANRPDANPGGWRIYTINADGTGLTAVTKSDRNIDLSQFGSLAADFAYYDDTDPVWLPDGRIAFSSTRYPETAEYEGVLASNLFVVNADGTSLHRITSEKGGADRPLVDPITGQIVFSRWWRNNHFGTDNFSTVLCSQTTGPECTSGTGYDYKDGLTISRGDATANGIADNLDTNGWQEDAINPDGTGLHAFNISVRDSRDGNVGYGGAFLSDGRLITNFFMPGNLAEEAGFGGLRLLTRGFQPFSCIIGVCTEYNQTLVPGATSDIFTSATGYAAEAAPLPNGRIVVARAANLQQAYGLWVMNLNGSNAQLLHADQGMTDTRPAILAPRPLPPIIPNTVTTVAPLTPPPVGGPYNQDGTFTFQDLNVYYNAPVDSGIPNAPPVGSLAYLTFFADPQQGSASASIPATSWPIKLATATVSSQGEVVNTNAPADMPLFEQGRDSNGNLVPTIDPATNQANGATHVAGMNYGRPGTVVQCVGCHAGHSVLQVPANPQFTNLATGATVTASSIDTNPDQNGTTPKLTAINNRLVKNQPFNNYWRSAPGQVQGQWVQLTFPVPVIVSDVRLYNPVPGTDKYGDQDNIQVQGATVTLYSDTAGTQQVASTQVGPLTTTPGQGTDVGFNNVTARVVRVTINAASGTFDGQPAASLAQIEVIAEGN